MFPSFNSIEEIRVSESNNNAEFGGRWPTSTTSPKPAANRFHGGVFGEPREHGAELERSLSRCRTQDRQ